jgi:Fe-S-cluster-containing dehydrogenase component
MGGVTVDIHRRNFLKIVGAAAVSTAFCPTGKARATATASTSDDSVGCLVDTTLCVGCRRCEQACNKRHSLPEPDLPFEETSVVETLRRPALTSYTVVNKYYPKHIGTLTWRRRPTFVKVQCMHCTDPSCASACITGALSKQQNGAVIYDASKCIGCRYCMYSCPFQIPAYEYNNALTPRVRKCIFCYNDITKGGFPACAQTCPKEVITFGKRPEVLELARWKMTKTPGKYVDHIYGEHEIGGTSWLYIASEPFETLGFPKLGTEAPPRLTEAIQHGLFQYMAAPIGLYLILGAVMWTTGFYSKKRSLGREDSSEEEDNS